MLLPQGDIKSRRGDVYYYGVCCTIVIMVTDKVREADNFCTADKLIALSIETVHLEPPRGGHLSTLGNEEHAVCPQKTAICTK